MNQVNMPDTSGSFFEGSYVIHPMSHVLWSKTTPCFTIAAALARILENESLDGMLDARVRGTADFSFAIRITSELRPQIRARFATKSPFLLFSSSHPFTSGRHVISRQTFQPRYTYTCTRTYANLTTPAVEPM